jgi:hypothetical protein
MNSVQVTEDAMYGTGSISHAAYLRGGWKRKATKMRATHLFSFIRGSFSEFFEDSCVRVVARPDGEEIRDPTPTFQSGELDIILDAAKEIQSIVKNGGRVLVVCRGGKNRSVFLANLARKECSRAHVFETMPVDPYLCDLLTEKTEKM